MNVAVIGASNKSNRYSHQAVVLLKEKGHTVFPVHPRIKNINGLAVFPSIKDIDEDLHTVTMYVSPVVSNAMVQDILQKRPQRIIFNPGSENVILEENARALGIVTLNACTLILLKTMQF